ncbi:MAG: Ala-tRNA(Pro) deacylase [Verrucomicrobiales bacterium]|jgi:Ala-tRNA(Pro) deacylase
MSDNYRSNVGKRGEAHCRVNPDVADMSISQLKSYLDENGVDYLSIRHDSAPPERLALGDAGFAKAVIVKVDDELAMVVLPAGESVDLESVCKAADGASVEIAAAAEVRARFPDCEPDAIPPLGNFYDVLSFLSPKLAAFAEISFHAGSRSELIRMSFDDFECLTGTATIKLTDKPTLT